MFENIPKNWKKEKLENIATVNYGTRIVKDSAIGNEYYVYGGGDKTFKTDIFNRENTLIVARFGMSPKCTRFVKGKFFLNDSGLTVDTNDEHLLNQNFLNWQLFFLNDLIYSLGKGVAQKNLNVSLFKNLDIIVPKSLNEQQEIVDVLDAADRIIRLRKECIKSAQSLIPALFQEMFGDIKNNTKNWKSCNLNDLVYIDRKNISVNELKSNAYRYIGLEHIEKDTGKILIDLENNFNVDLKSNKYYFTNEHVLYGKLRPYLNKVALPTCDGVCSTDIFPIMPRKNISNKYFIKYLMSSPYFVQITSLKTSGANLPRIGTKALELIKVICPDIEIQNQFAAKVQEIEAYIKSQQAELENAKTMFQSLLHHSFTGELTRRAYEK